jgi:histidyl-tRNA synthetase
VEAVTPEVPSSIAGGGRYDKLIGKMFGTGDAVHDVPAVGFALGIERIITALRSRDDEKDRQTDVQCYVTFVRNKKDENSNKILFQEVLKITKELWDAGICTKFVGERKQMLGEQIKEQLQIGVPFMVLIGGQELEKGVVKIKHLAQKSEEEVSRQDVVQTVAKMIGVIE